MEFKPAISLDEFKSSFGQSLADASGKTAPAAASPVKSVKNPFDDAAAFTMGEEGGYVKNDAGKGETNLGVNKTANPDIDVKALTPEKAKWEVYKPRYWDAIGGDEIAAQNPTLAKVAFDTAFNMGVEPAKQMLKQSGGDPLRMLALRAERYRSLLAANPDKFGQYANGWQQRLNKLHALVQEGGGYALPANSTVASGPSDFTGERSTAGGANWNPVERTLGDSVVGGFKKGFDQSLGLGASALALANRSITGEENNDFQKSMLSYAKQKEEDAAGHSGNAPSFTDAAFGDASFKHWLGDSIGYLTYQALESFASGGAGALLGKTVGKGAVETVAKGMIEKEVGRIVSTEAGKSLAKEEIGKLAARNVAQKLTAGTALFANNLRQEAGGVYSDALDNQSKTGTPVDLTNVWLSSLAATGVDTAADIAALRGLLGKEASSAKTLAGRAATQLPRQMGIQGGTEYTQSVIEQAGAGKNPFTASGQLEAFNEGAVGALGGILPGAASSFHRAEVDPKLKPVLDKAQESNSPLSKAAAEGIKAQPITESQPASQDAAQRLAELEQKLQSSSLSGEEVQEYKTLRQLKDDNDAIRNELSGAGAEKQDDILYRASQIEQAVNTNSGISALRQPDSPVDAKQFLNDLAIAKSKSSNPAAREQALSRLEFAAGWMGIDLTGPAPVAGPGKVWSQEGKAAQNAIGKAAEIAGPQDSISKRVSEIEDEIRSTNAISALRSIGQPGVTEKEFFEALAIAKNPALDKTYPGLRQRALESLETGMNWVRQGSMPGVGSKVNFTFGDNNPTGTSLTVPGSRKVGPVGSGQFFDPNVIDGEATRVDENRLPGPRSITGPQSSAIQAIAPESRGASSPAGSTSALGFTGTASPAEQQNVAPATAAQGETPAQQAPALSVSEATSDMPRVAIPQDNGSGATAARRKRKAQITQLVQAGFGTVEKRGDGFVLHNVKTGQSVDLDGAADVQMARQAVTQAQRSQADTSPNSPANDKTPASEAQIAAGNYSKPSSVVNGITVRYENPKGSTRSGVDSDGVVWSTTMKHDYGHDDRVVGADGDKLDIFVGDHPASSKIFVIDQQNQDGSFDEHKVILGARSEDEARKTYLANYESGWTGLGDITELTREQYDAWTAGGRVSEPISLGKNDVVTLSDAGQPVKVQLISADEIGSGKKPGNGYYALTKQDAGIISAIGAALGVRTAFFRGVTPGFSPDGIYTQGNTVLMGESYSRGPLSVFLHEFTHLLEGSNPKAYGSLMAVIRSRVADPKGYRADYYGKQYAEQKSDTALSDDELRELIGDLGGDMMNDAAFWGDVFADIQAKHGKEAQGIIAKLAEFLDSLIQKAIASIPQKAFGASKFVNEASEIREAFRTAVTSYMEENGFQYNGAASDIAKAAQMMAEQKPFDSAAWNKERDDRIKASKAAGNKHLDQVPAYVETMRGKTVYNVHDPKERGTIRTVDNRGNVYVNWADQYSADKNLASPSMEGNTKVFQTTLGRTDLKDYVLGDGDAPKAAKPDDAQNPQQQSVSEDVLQDVGLLREYAGRWKYRTRPEGTWFTANSKADAIDRATAGYLSMPESDRLTRAQRDAKADAEYDAESERRYGRLSIEQLEKLLGTTAGDIAANQKAGQSEFNGNGGRRTGAAVSNEAARVLGEERMRLERYIASRKAADAQKPTQESSAPTASDDGIKVRAGKGLIKGKFNAEADGDVVPGGPFDTEQAARAAALQWRAKSKQRADDAAAEKVRRDAIAQKFRDGKPVTAIEIKSLGLPAGTSDVRDFFGIAADLFGLKSRDIRPIVKDLIRESTTDMGAKREYVATRKALEAIGKSQSEGKERQGALADLTDDELNSRAQYIADQAKINGGWSKALTEARNDVQREIEARASKQPAGTDAVGKDANADNPQAFAPSEEEASGITKAIANAKRLLRETRNKIETEPAQTKERRVQLKQREVDLEREIRYLRQQAAEQMPTAEAAGKPAKSNVSNPAAKIDTSAKPVEATTELPEGWSGSTEGVATSKDPETGGIVDKSIVSGEWFAVPNKAGAATLEGFKTQADAIAALRKAADKPVEAPAKADPFANNTLFTSDAVAKARARLKSKLNQLNSGFDPELAMDGMVIAGAYIESGVRKFSSYAKAMIDDLGPKVTPFLLSFYEAARNYPGLDTNGMTPVADAKAEFDAMNAKPEPVSVEASKPAGQPVKAESMEAFEAALKAGEKVHYDYAGTDGSTVWIEPSGKGTGWVVKQKNDDSPGITYTTGGNPMAGGYSRDEAVSRSKEIVAYRFNEWKPLAEGNDNGTQQLDKPGPQELARKQSQDGQGAGASREAGEGSQGGSRADVRGDERSGGERIEQPGRLGNDAREVPASATGEGIGRGGEPGRSAVQRGERPAKPDTANGAGNREIGNQPELTPESGTRAQDRADGFTITEADAIGEGGAKTKYKQNVAAIRLLKELTAANRQATRAEQAVLAKYVGWGGIPQAFYRDNGEVSKGWEKEAAELKALLTPEELAAAAASTRNAHYTSTEIVSAIWTALRHFGFKGGRVLEPSVGAGNFFGLMPGALRSASQLTGVELDHITGGIAKQLYPQANIQAPVGFQDFSAPDNYFDVATGNPPFGPEGIYDAIRRKISGFSIHNYFFAKSIDTVKPNGVLAMVVTNRLLDSMGDKARQYIANRAEFLGAIRLPNDAFLKNAGTQVTTDIIFLRKLTESEYANGLKTSSKYGGQDWMDVKQVTDKNGKTVPLNEYFVRNPDMMLGEFGAYGSMYRPDDAALVARPGQDTQALLAAAIAKLPQGFMDGPTSEPTRETIESPTDISRVKVGSVFEHGGKIFERKEDMLGKQQAKEVTFASDKARERVTGMIQVRDALISVRGLQLTEGVSDKAMESARAGLNKVYDAFVKAHGPINSDANKRLMRDDPTWPQLAALEDGFDKGITAAVAKTTGEKPRPASAKKAAIFFKRTQAPYHAPTKAESAKDALVTSLSERGRVDLDYMAGLYGKTPEAIARELDGLIFEVVPGEFVTREEYLSGNVKKRLALTLQLAEKIPRFHKNVEALRAVQPADIEAVDIDVKTGAHWVPADVMEDFVSQVTEGKRIKAVYNPITATWTLYAEQISNAAFTKYATDRASIMKVLEAAANQKQIQVFDEDRSTGTRTLNEAATTAANAKVELVKSEWKSWIWSDDARRERLTRIYNDTFNTDVQREFDGSHLTFPGKVGDDIIRLRPHQANAVWRMVQSGTTLLDHVVGAGKTFTMIAGIMEMRRMGLAKKPMLVVPNHLVGQWAEDFMKLYPGANILAATKKDFEKDNRKKLFARIATGDWDAVIVAHSSFGKVEVEPEFQEAFIKQQISDMDVSISAMRAAEGKGSRNVKQIEKQKAALEEKLKRLFDTGSKDDNLYFNELGVDAVLLDEAHEFKNLGFSTGMQRVAGLGNPTGSNKAADMFMKVQSVLKRTGGRNVVFATGTPISNTMAEMYTMQRYLDYGTLKDQGIAHFDAWAKTFGEVVTDWELSPSGQYKMNSRFAKFVNMPELMQRYQSFSDVINRDDINRQLAAQGKRLPVPKVKGGKPENTVVDRSQDQARYIGIPTVDDNGIESYPQDSLIWRSENLPKKAEKGSDNMLKIMSDARKAALDMRLIDPSYPDNPGSKVNVAAKSIKEIYDKWTPENGTQLVFIDLSTPKGAVAKEAAALRELVKLAEEGDESAQSKLDAMSPDELLALDSAFSVYDDLKAKLIGLGIPENEIAFIHDANTELQKEELFAKVRTGRVRVLFGSTAKMGAGMNVQDRLVALHHLDAPWRPSDLEQREGRIIRQGNKLYEADPEGFEVEIKRYATKQTLDSRMWQTIEAKARFIEQVRKGAGTSREVEDVAGEAANSAEMKAASSGNPLILEEMSLRQAIRKLENSQAEHNREQHRIKDQMRWVEQSAKNAEGRADIMEADAPKAPKTFAVTIGDQTFKKHGEAGEAIIKITNDLMRSSDVSREIGTYGGFKLTADKASMNAVLTVSGKGEYQVNVGLDPNPTGLALRLQNTVKGLDEAAAEDRARAERARADIPKLEAQIKPWGQEQELAEAKARHATVIDQLKPKKRDAQAEQDAKFSTSRSDQDDATLSDYNQRIESMKELLSCIGK